MDLGFRVPGSDPVVGLGRVKGGGGGVEEDTFILVSDPRFR